MRCCVIGAGAIGGLVAGRLAEAGHDVVVVARGEHGRRIAERGLVIRDPTRTAPVPLVVAGSPAGVADLGERVVMIATKSQDTLGVLDAIVATDARPPIVCLQNGVDNERHALRRFPLVYGVPVMCPSTHLEPGVVEVWSTPVAGILDVGRYPDGADDTAAEVAAAFEGATFVSEPRPDIMRWKWAKLLLNLVNAVEALCPPSDQRDAIATMAIEEGRACMAAAGIEHASADEDVERRGDLLRLRPIEGRRRAGGSTWQSLARGSGIETDHLNGEIVLLGRLHRVRTPVNEVLQAEMHRGRQMLEHREVGEGQLRARPPVRHPVVVLPEEQLVVQTVGRRVHRRRLEVLALR